MCNDPRDGNAERRGDNADVHDCQLHAAAPPEWRKVNIFARMRPLRLTEVEQTWSVASTSCCIGETRSKG
jgi:hypothetical protein